MKKQIITGLFATLLVLSLSACAKEDDSKIVVGASSTPHAEILEQVKESLKEEGYKLEIKVLDDYVTPNTFLEEGTIDANYFQHTPYLENFNKEKGTHLVAVAKIHYEPLAIYGKNVSATDYQTNKSGRTIIIPSDGSNCTRALFVLQDEGYISLKAGVKASDNLSVLDIADAKNNTVTPVEAKQIPAQLANAQEGTIACINGNYALAAGLNFSDSLASEVATGEAALLYANIIAVKKGKEDSPKIKALVKALQSEKVYNYINNTYAGAVKPSFSLDK
ncbi:metal ABC transporter substrate-binding protein [bacterium]|jgi:D-methionine transport system substrate-binding protein|nr:metal ABC transporter substrate-binding protein [bacterium]